jgi:amidase
MTDELWRKSALDLASGIRSREFSSREVIESHLSRIGEVNQHLNAIVVVLADDARSAADEADQATARGEFAGAFHGVPFTIKTNIDVEGQPTTNGLPIFADAVAPSDAPTVERMRAAGAIPIGRTNMPDMGLRVHTDSSLYGRTKNPWDPERTAGGSSGGEGASIASGMSPIGLGNDIGGSLRNPAHACGITSIKPSLGVVPDAETYPTPDRMLSAQLMLNQGVMARRVADVRAGLETVAGRHPRDPVSAPVVLTDLEPGQKLKVAVLANPPGGSTHPQIAAAVSAAGDALSDAGHDVVEATPPDYEWSLLLWCMMLFPDFYDLRDLLNLALGDGGRRVIDLALEQFPELTSLEKHLAHQERDGVARKWQLWFEEYPILLTPTWTQPPFVKDFDIESEESALATLELFRPVLPGNLLGLPCAVVPGGMADDLPVGVHVTGARYSDLRVLSIAQQIEDAYGVITPIDPR